MKFVGVKNEAGDFATQSDVGSVYTAPNELVGSSDGHLWYDTDEEQGDYYNWDKVTTWNPVTPYRDEGPVSVVLYQGSAYVAIQPSVNVIPSSDPTKWQLIASKGDPGTNGTNGTNGVNGSDATALVNNDPPTVNSLGGPLTQGQLWVEPDGSNLSRQELYGRRANQLFGGGQARKIVSTSGVSWSSPSPSCLNVYGAGRGVATAPDGYFRVYLPANGTIIQKIGAPTAGPHTVTVTGGYIPMLAGETLWWAIPMGSTANTAGTFYITAAGSGGAGANYEIPETWLRIVSRAGGYPSDPSAYIWGDGMQQSYWTGVSLLNGWVNYGSTYATPAWKKVGGYVTWRGLIANGTSDICALDPNTNGWGGHGGNGTYLNEIFNVMATMTVGRVDAYRDKLTFGGGTNSWVSLATVAYWNTPDS